MSNTSAQSGRPIPWLIASAVMLGLVVSLAVPKWWDKPAPVNSPYLSQDEAAAAAQRNYPPVAGGELRSAQRITYDPKWTNATWEAWALTFDGLQIEVERPMPRLNPPPPYCWSSYTVIVEAATGELLEAGSVDRSRPCRR